MNPQKQYERALTAFWRGYAIGIVCGAACTGAAFWVALTW